jgi:uncharacterized protein (DUF2062 family)
MKDKFLSYINRVFNQLFKIDDSPHKIALGFGLGVFLGIFPGTGILAALFMAFILRLNRASALLGAILSNTWTSIIAFVLAAQIGSFLTKTSWQDIYNSWQLLLSNFHWQNLFKASFLEILLPLLLGYLVIGLVAGILAYFVTLLLLIFKQKGRGQ